MVERMTIAEAQTERARILGFRSLSTADWQRVQRLNARIFDLLDAQYDARRPLDMPLEIAEKVERFPRIQKAVAR